MISNFPYPTFNPLQKETLQLIEDSFKIYDTIILEAKTAFGKSAIAMAVSKYFKESHIITVQKTLQDQYIVDFSISKIQGRPNFNCLNNNKTCSEGECKTNSSFKCNFSPTPFVSGNGEFAAYSEKRGNLYWKFNKHCPYWEQKIIAMNDKYIAHNYPYFLTELKYVKDLGMREVLICDECHNIEQQLLNFISLKITELNIQNLYETYFPQYQEDDIESWIKWVMNTNSDIKLRLKELDKTIKREKELDSPLINLHIGELKALKKIESKIKYLLDIYQKSPNNWIINIEKYKNKTTSVEFKPLFVNNFSQELLFQYGKKKLLMSATVLNQKKLVESLGLDPKTTCFIKVPSTIPPQNQPIYNLNVVKINKDTMNEDNPFNTIQKMVDSIDTLLDIFPNNKGIIHTTTYKISNYIEKYSRHKNRILTHTTSTRMEILNKHLTSKEPTVLCSPSMTEGVDLKYDLSRFQILIKVPYPNLGDKIIKRRMELDQEYYNWRTCIDTEQAKGRSIRTPTDIAITFTIAIGFEYFIRNNAYMLQDNFLHLIRPTDEFMKQYENRIRTSITKHPNNIEWITKYSNNIEWINKYLK